jgi:hypothetical protein
MTTNAGRTDQGAAGSPRRSAVNGSSRAAAVPRLSPTFLLGLVAAAALAFAACSGDLGGASSSPDDGDLFSSVPTDGLASPAAMVCDPAVESAMGDAVSELEAADPDVDLAGLEVRLSALAGQLESMSLEGAAADARDAAVDAIDTVVEQATTGALDASVTGSAADALGDLQAQVC